ncbi:MAG: DUF4175 family protein [Gemmatimonadota bacterium]|nr:DUF4175 family protein [Gemmatimonadota bacterium]MDE2864062.1 DUF4175 family protein [Gemmatimonadota bacterium]
MPRTGNRHSDGQILRVVRQVRRRWRLKLLLRGLALTAAAVLATFLISASSLEVLRFSPGAVMAMRIVLWVVVTFFLARWILWPLFRPVADERVALYLEENEPSLQSRVLTAVESARGGRFADTELSREVVRRAVRRCRRIDYGRRIEQRSIRRSTGVLGGLTLASVVLLLAGPGFLRHGMSALFFPVRAAESVNPYSVSVEPGDTIISRNSDLMISAAPHGFDPDDVILYTRMEGEDGYSALPMIEDGAGGHEGLLLNVAEETTYYVEANGVRSGTFTLGVADLPAVDRLEMVYHFPRYTGLAPRRFEYGGDVAALAGTRVEITVTPTLATPAAQVVMDTGDTLSMETGPEGTFGASFVVREEGFYGIRFLARDEVWVAGAPDYRIDVLHDQGPSISFNRPGRDIEVSSIEEVFIEARADDDLGVAEILLVYSVNGGPSDTLPIHSSAGAPLTEVTAGHTVFMEEYELEVGDLIAYHGVARDNAPSPGEAMTDIYFLQVRPFRRDYREAEGGAPQGGGGGGGGGGDMEQDLSALQRQIIAATFNLVRDRDSYTPESWEENVVSVALTQERLREQVETLTQRILNRGITRADEAFQRIAEALPVAVEAMNEAVDSLRALAPGGAISPEQSALRQLQKAEETYERFVSMERQQQGGGGGRQGQRGPSAEDLADLFELETDKLRNQYETVQRSQQESADQEVDELMEKLRELARRQEQELERQQRRAAAQQGGQAGGGSDAARELAEEAEEAARELERLSRETGERQLEEISRQLQQSADAMRRSAANRGTAGVAEARSALRRLRDARDQLGGAQDERLERDLQDARERVDELARQQEDVENRMEAMSRVGRPSADQVGRIRETKESMAEEVGDILAQLDQLAASARREGTEGARELEDATRTIRETQLRERLLYSRGLVGRPGQEEYAQAFENQTAQAIQSLGNRLEEAAEAIQGRAEGNSQEEALESARDLVRSLESMERRLESSQQASGEQGRGEQAGGEQTGGEQAGGEQTGGEQAGGEQRAGNPTGGERAAGGTPGARDYREGDPRGYGGGGWRDFDPEAIRQMRREVRERIGETQALGRLLERVGASPQELQDMIEAMRALDREGTYADPEEVARLQSELVETIKQLEFRLRREFAVDEEGEVFLYQSGDVPEEYRALVEEYYRALSRGSGREPR